MADPDLDDLLAWQRGDTRAGNRLLKKYHRDIHRFFDRKMNGDVYDLVQATFLTCLKAKDSFEGRSTFRTFLFGIARNKFLEHLRALRRPGASPSDFTITSLVDLGLTPTQRIAGQQHQRLILEAVRRIPVEQQLILELYYWEGFTGGALAELYDTPENTVRGRIRKAKASLRRALEELGDDPVLRETTQDLDGHMKELREAALRKLPRMVEPDQ